MSLIGSNHYLLSVELLRQKVPSFRELPAICKLERLELDPHVTFVVGDNGSGKSTLLGLGLNANCGRFGNLNDRNLPPERFRGIW